jgi:diacylglycerol kinase (ATP)
VWHVLRSQPNARLHAIATAAVVVLGGCFHLSGLEWSCLVLAITAVWTAEAMNTALELLADAASPEFHPLIGRAKDVAAGAVLLSAVGALVVGLAVLGPHVVSLL